MPWKNSFRTSGIVKILIVLFLITWAGTVLAHGLSDADRQAMVDGGNLQFIRLGASHMLTGYDHLLFLLGVVFFLTKFRDIAKFITAFTVGHSITLIFATFMGITANYFLIDAVIALTVVYKGFDNLGGFKKYFKIDSPNLVALVFLFGLIHGFGLSTRLQQLPLGDSGLIWRILSFNLGVELGQIVGLTVMLALLNLWRRSESFKRFSHAVNWGLVVAGLGLFVFQMVGFSSGKSPEPAQKVVMAAAAWDDSLRIGIAADSSVEYKFNVVTGGVMEFKWRTVSGEVYYDFHGEAHDAKPDEFTSFESLTSSTASGSLTAPFDGRAGWYWRNKNPEPVEIRLFVRGDYSKIE